MFAEAVFEKNFTVEMQIAAEKEKAAKEEADTKAKEAEETWAKLGDKISSFWGTDEEKKEGEEGGEKTEGDKEEGNKEEDKKEETGDKKKKEDEKKKDDKKKPKKEAPKKPIITTIKEPLTVEVEVKDLPLLGDDQKKESGVKLKAWADHDKALAERATAFNDLESYVIDMEGTLLDLWQFDEFFNILLKNPCCAVSISITAPTTSCCL